VRHSRLSLRAAGLFVGLASVALIAFQPSDPAGAAGLQTGRLTGSAGATAAQVGSRLVIDNLSESATGRSGSNHASAGGAVTIALSSLHLPAPARPAAPRPVTPVPPVPVAAPATTVPTPTPAPVPVPAPMTPAPASPAPAGPLVPSAAVWAELRQCESGDNYAINTGNGYYGAYQFSASTWAALGYPGLPNQAAPAVQDQAAQRLEAMRGWEPWPGCSAKLGL
jgi:hypothetical protein